MFNVTIQDIDIILRDFGVSGKCLDFNELQRYHYEKYDPSSTEVRLIVKTVLDNGYEFVIRFKNEEDVTFDIIHEQSCFAALLAENGIETPRVYSSFGQYARWYQIGGYRVIVTVEEFVTGELNQVDIEAAEQTGRLLARMHNIAEAADFHVHNDVLFHPLKRNDLFSFEDFTAHEDFLVSVDATLYHEIVNRHEQLFHTVRCFENEPQFAVQGDISDCNLYRTADGNIGVFDFNRCGDNVLYYDAVMQAIFEARLMDYPQDLAENHEDVILSAFLKAYHQERPFTERQIDAFPYLYALVSAFWLIDIKWDEKSLTNAIQKGDTEAALNWMKKIYTRITHLPAIPI